MHIIVCGSPNELSERAADHIASIIDERPGPLSMGLAGGNTPKPVYAQLAARNLDWSNVYLWVGDERWVPHHHADSNSGMARSLLAENVEATFLPFPFQASATPHEAAAQYGQLLTATIPTEAHTVALLGMGDDGHTASLFPGSDALAATGVYAATWVEAKSAWRVTATMNHLASADEIVFLIAGSDKAEVLEAVASGSVEYPAGRLIAEARGSVTIIVDAAAGHLLGGSAR